MQYNTPTISFGFSKYEAILFSLIAEKELKGDKLGDSNSHSFDLTLERIRDSSQNISQDFMDNLRKTVSLIASRKITLGNRKDKEELTIMPLFAKLHISNNSLSVTFNNNCLPIIRPVINSYPDDALVDILRLNSFHSIKLYQLLHTQPDLTISLNDLRRYLGLTGCYERYYSFKHDVIIASQKEINTKTGFYFEFKEIKDARKICEMKFSLTKVAALVGNSFSTPD